MWMAWLSVRLPRRFKRCRILGPEDASTGAVAVVGGVPVSGGEPGDVAGVADDERSHDRAHTSDLEEGGAGGGHRLFDLSPVAVEVSVETPNVHKVLTGHRFCVAHRQRLLTIPGAALWLALCPPFAGLTYGVLLPSEAPVILHGAR